MAAPAGLAQNYVRVNKSPVKDDRPGTYIETRSDGSMHFCQGGVEFKVMLTRMAGNMMSHLQADMKSNKTDPFGLITKATTRSTYYEDLPPWGLPIAPELVRRQDRGNPQSCQT